MKTYEATELAYKNGYSKGYQDAMRDVIRIIREKQEANKNHDETRIGDHH